MFMQSYEKPQSDSIFAGQSVSSDDMHIKFSKYHLSTQQAIKNFKHFHITIHV